MPSNDQKEIKRAVTKGGNPAVHSAVDRVVWSELKTESYELTGDPANFSWAKNACSRANLRACGDFKDEDWGKPFISIAAPYSNALPCNHHFVELANVILEEVEKRGGRGVLHYPAVISDGITNGTKGMKYSLVSRELIADSIELMHGGYVF